MLASDKTGTLTQNKMTVSHIWVDTALKTALYMKKEGAWRASSDTFIELVYAGALCNMAKFEEGPLQEVTPLTAARLMMLGNTTTGTASQEQQTSQYLRSRRLMTDFNGVETQDGRSLSRARSGNRLNQIPASILVKDFFEEPQDNDDVTIKSHHHDRRSSAGGVGVPPPPASAAIPSSPHHQQQPSAVLSAGGRSIPHGHLLRTDAFSSKASSATLPLPPTPFPSGQSIHSFLCIGVCM